MKVQATSLKPQDVDIIGIEKLKLLKGRVANQAFYVGMPLVAYCRSAWKYAATSGGAEVNRTMYRFSFPLMHSITFP